MGLIERTLSKIKYLASRDTYRERENPVLNNYENTMHVHELKTGKLCILQLIKLVGSYVKTNKISTLKNKLQALFYAGLNSTLQAKVYQYVRIFD